MLLTTGFLTFYSGGKALKLCMAYLPPLEHIRLAKASSLIDTLIQLFTSMIIIYVVEQDPKV